MFNRLFSGRVISVDILAALFGVSAWVAVNGVWSQTPILALVLPEGWKLASYLVVGCQLANIGPIIYSILKYRFSQKTIEKPAIHVTLGIGAIACLMLALFWDKIHTIDGTPHSVVFLSLTTLLAVIDCTTTVLYLPFMAYFKSKYLMSYLVGQGLSGLIPSVLAIIQGIGGNPDCVNSTTDPHKTVPIYPEPRFSVTVFLIFLMCLVVLSWFAFILLNQLKTCQSERVPNEDISHSKSISDCRHLGRVETNSVRTSSVESTTSQLTFASNVNLTENSAQNISQKFYITLLATQAYTCFLTNGVIPSIQSYSCMPYGNLTYNLAVNLSCISNPIACFIPFYISSKTLQRTLPVTIVLGTLCVPYLLATALLSPTPPLQDSTIGKVLCVLMWILYSSFFSYSRAGILSLLRNTSTGHKALYFSGVFNQFGSTLGAILMFVIINFTNTFVGFFPCI